MTYIKRLNKFLADHSIKLYAIGGYYSTQADNLGDYGALSTYNLTPGKLAMTGTIILATGFVATLAVAKSVGLAAFKIGFRALYLVGVHSFGSLLSPYRLRGFGLVYDSSTRRPVKKTVVQLVDQNTHKLLSATVTDKNGVYAFSAKPGLYTIRAIKPGFTFPSRHLEQNLAGNYFGQTLSVTDQNPAINYLIPIDPVVSKRS